MPCGDVIRAAKHKATADMLDISRLHNLQTVAQPASLAQGRVPFVAEAAGTGVSRCLLWMQAAQMHKIGDRDQQPACCATLCLAGPRSTPGGSSYREQQQQLKICHATQAANCCWQHNTAPITKLPGVQLLAATMAHSNGHLAGHGCLAPYRRHAGHARLTVGLHSRHFGPSCWTCSQKLPLL